ncbi:hypothetical protein BX600DRAFT_430993 [Xylariales sp. PMI_506]|nr:hypothetical protein BX600DRAFT_430993 [Xylariales sp. PMI_506]
MSGMFSNLRFHRRGPSNPTSPIPDSGSWENASPTLRQPPSEDGSMLSPEARLPSQFLPHPQYPPPPAPPVQQYAPSLPPIARVASTESEGSINLREYELRSREEPRAAPARSPYTEDTGFIGGLALQNYRREQKDAEKASSYVRAKSPAVVSPPGRSTPSFVSPTDLSHHIAPTGKRQPGARVPPEPQLLSPGPPQEPSRGKKGLPFLKNPMSTLLLRRKSSQNVLPSLTIPQQESSYQPIRGTKIHDFSAPRPKKVATNNSDLSTTGGPEKLVVDALSPPVEDKESPPSPAPPVPPKDDQVESIKSSSSTRSRPYSTSAAQDSPSDIATLSSRRTKDDKRRQSSIPSSISTLSRNTSNISSRDVMSSLPRHMKSTSSRFSFDMLGAANAEKVLEERHRQRQQEKVPELPGQRDSRFDDFDEDGFDYDAMDFDDGLEEAIPGVNVDYEEDEFEAEIDPDNDQENFAGFVFQRSGPTSTLTSPLSAGLALPTPRDGEGNVIGFAMSKDSPNLKQLSAASAEPRQVPPLTVLKHDSPTGLGIQGLDEAIEEQERLSMHARAVSEYPTNNLDREDELYFGGAGHEFEGEGDGSAIDESLFDLDDTDQYGRPIPGMFANALAQRMNAQEAGKRASDDVTSKHSSALTQSTAHTSLSLGLQQNAPEAEETHDVESCPTEESEIPIPNLSTTAQDTMAAYQAALAAAAHKAAASGKFRRDSSPPLPADLTITSPTTTGSEESNNINSLADYEAEDDDYGYDDDGFSNGLDDYDLDDDAIIAEANASALANDSDGWYGQEFGFYAAPAQSSLSHHGSRTMPEQEQFHYGGFFGGSGVTRSKSGHIVSREPNLTPITELSEYSNRNSIMSLQMPPNNRDSSIQSPGLAQLAMMADDDNMSLSALLRLRNKAWGGSQASLVSSRDGSPGDRNGASSPLGQGDLLGVGYGHRRKNSSFSIWSQDSGAGSGSGSPTLTMAMPIIPNNAIPPLNVTSNSNATNLASSPLAAPQPSIPFPASGFPPVIESEEASESGEDDLELSNSSQWPKLATSEIGSSNSATANSTSPSQKHPGMGHRHKGSSDSISYMQEEDSGETRWVMERRRTAESGEIEILGREVVEGGRI